VRDPRSRSSQSKSWYKARDAHHRRRLHAWEDLLDGAVAIVVDVIRATTTILHALAGGFAEVWCVRTVEEARAAGEELGSSGILAGEREGVAPPGFALGNSPLAFADPPAAGQTLILTTTNGTAAIIHAVDSAGEVLVGALVNLRACATTASELALARGGNVVVCCAGVSDDPASTTPMSRGFSSRSSALGCRATAPPTPLAWHSSARRPSGHPRTPCASRRVAGHCSRSG